MFELFQKTFMHINFVKNLRFSDSVLQKQLFNLEVQIYIINSL